MRFHDVMSVHVRKPYDNGLPIIFAKRDVNFKCFTAILIENIL